MDALLGFEVLCIHMTELPALQYRQDLCLVGRVARDTSTYDMYRDGYSIDNIRWAAVHVGLSLLRYFFSLGLSYMCITSGFTRPH